MRADSIFPRQDNIGAVRKAQPYVETRAVVLLVSLMLLVTSCLSGCEGAAPSASNGSDSVLVKRSAASTSARSLTAIGEVQGLNTVSVKSRVDGPIVQITFREGENIRKGDLLAVIDPATYQVALNQATALRDRDAATFNEVEASLARYKALFEEGIIAKQDFEKQEADFYQQQSSLRADQSAVDRAVLDLTYTRIVAPIGGRLGFKSVGIGNIVHPNDPNGIITITQIQPIAIVFSVSPDYLNLIVNGLHNHSVSIEAFDEKSKTFLGRGAILAIDPSIDSSTGSAKIKAVFQNTDNLLWPNEFVQIRIALDGKE